MHKNPKQCRDAALFTFTLQTLGIPNNVSAHTGYTQAIEQTPEWILHRRPGRKEGKTKVSASSCAQPESEEGRNGNISHTSINIFSVLSLEIW